MEDSYKSPADRLCYPGTDTLKNKLGIKDEEDLFNAERELVSLRLAELNEKPIKGSFDLNHLRKIHAYLFQDVYAWAGQIRTYNITKEKTLFCLSEYIYPCAEDIFGALHNEKFYTEYDYETKLLKLARLFADINALHPFREGNGRTQRVFIESLARVAGVSLDLTRVSKKEMMIASLKGMLGKPEVLLEIFKANSHSIPRSVQLANIQRLLANKDKVLIMHLLKDAPQKELK